MYTINKTNGIGEVVKQDETTFTVYFSETGQTSTLLKAFVKIYDTYEAAQAVLEEREMNEEIGREDRKSEDAKIMAAGITASTWLSEKNREAGKKIMSIR